MRRLLLACLLCGAVARADVAVDSTGNVLRGSATIDKQAATVSVGRKTLPFDQVFLVEKDDGTLLFAPDFAARLRGYERLVREEERGAYLSLVRKAMQLQDFPLAERALEAAESAGLSGKELSRTKKRLEATRLKRNGIVRKALREQMERIGSMHGRLLAARAERALAGGIDGPRLLREALRRDPESALGKELLQKIAPPTFPIGNARTWLDWHVDLEGAGATIAKGDEPALDLARRKWRHDLQGVDADPILMVTPVRDSKLIGRCLAYGRLCCKALSELFASEADAPRRRPPMTVFLFESRDEYLHNTGTGKRRENPADLEWTTGHYSPSEGISRFFWLKDPDAERRIVGTCVHELTHHWLEERNPRIEKKMRLGDHPAYWIVEGFATFMEEGLFDADTGSWTLFNPRSRSLDRVQALGSRQMIPWSLYFSMRQVDFMRLPREREVPVQGRWLLHPVLLTADRAFYEQGGAACQYLYHADGGKHRRKLIDFVVAYYTGNTDMLDTKRAFGMSGAELGSKIEAFAAAVAKGWQPEPEK